jgi:hypothetical protein
MFAGTPGGSFAYAYDAMGNQTSDGRKGLQISYNIFNLPCGVTSATSGSQMFKICLFHQETSATLN